MITRRIKEFNVVYGYSENGNIKTTEKTLFNKKDIKKIARENNYIVVSIKEREERYTMDEKTFVMNSKDLEGGR